MTLEILDKNGNRRAYAKSEDAAEVKIEQLKKERPNMAPFTTQVCEPCAEAKATAAKKKRASKKKAASQE